MASNTSHMNVFTYMSITSWIMSTAKREIVAQDGSIVSCGHPGNNNMCFILCDDYINQHPSEGICYLKPLENRILAYSKLGRFPKFTKFLDYISTGVKCAKFSISGHNILHVELEDKFFYSVSPFIAHVSCTSCNASKISNLSYFEHMNNKFCKKCNEKLDVIILTHPEYSACMVGGIDYLMKEFNTDVQVHVLEGYIKDDVVVDRNEHDIIVKINDRVKFQEPIKSDKVKNIRHDFIGNEWKDVTDKKLSSIGVEFSQGNLTPDYVDTVSKKVVELGTCKSQYSNSLISMYTAKMLKYKDTVESVGGSLGVVIVGINRVATNLILTNDEVQTLINRFLIATNIEMEVMRLCGENFFSGAENNDIRLSDMIFKDIKMSPLEDKQYSYNKLKFFEEDMTSETRQKCSELLARRFNESKILSSNTPDDFDKYLSKFTYENSKTDLKRITNVPLLLTQSDAIELSLYYSDDDMDSTLYTLWRQASSFNPKPLTRTEIESGKHLNKKHNMFRPILDEQDKINLAMKGIGAKEWEEKHKLTELLEKQIHDKKSFHPNTLTFDIKDFLTNKKWFMELPNSTIIPDQLLDAVKLSKNLSTNHQTQESLKYWSYYNSLLIIQYSYMISYIFSEIAYCYKHWTPGQHFLKKKLNHGIVLLLYIPKGHLFVSMAFPKDNCIYLETGKIGPKLFDCGSHFISDFSSFNEPTIEHFIKCGPYMSSILAHLQSVSESSPDELSSYTRQCMPAILSLYLNNKTDVEELITSQRYLFMKLLEDVSPNPWVFVDRLPSVMRSRLTVYFLWETKKLMEYYQNNKIGKIPENSNGMILYNYTNIRSLFAKENVTLSQKVNEFYFGYVVSKERGRGGDRMFKVLSKMLEQEYNFRDLDPEPFTDSNDTPKFASNKHLLKTFSHNFASMLENKLGKEYKKRLYDDFLSEVAYTNFNKLATLKASARNHDASLNINNIESDISRRKIQAKIDEQNKHEVEKRPKMIAAIIDLVDKFKEEHNREPEHVIELLPWCLNKLLSKGRFDSDCFAKPQHGGDREIHVLEASMRIVQYHVELFARVVCKYFPSETTCNPDTKENFVKRHYAESSSNFQEFNTHSKSADASKWCQAHHTSHFAAMYMAIAPEELKPFLINSLSLWPFKTLNFPTTLAATMIKNMNNDDVSPLYKRFKNDYFNGTGLFSKPGDNKLQFKSGMFQGILHTTSSLYHTVVQENMRLFSMAMYKKFLNQETIITVVQGSDDSGMMISVPNKMTKASLLTVKSMLTWKEKVAADLSIYTNSAKSSIGTHDLIEYNSEWHSRHKIIKPTFRWISACLEVSVVEKFIDRYRISNGILTQCLEGGASTLECSIVQLNQCALHYMLIGFLTQSSAREMLYEYQINPEPSLGFFPCDYDVVAGITGVEFQLYNLYHDTNFGRTLRNKLSSEMSLYYTQDHLPQHLKVKDLQSIKLQFCNMRIFESFIKSLPIESLETAIEEIESNPNLLFGRHTSWKEDQPNLTLKVFSQGVKDSISNISPALRMMASSAYILTEKCLSILDSNEKYNLIDLSIKLRTEMLDDKLPEEQIFPLFSEFNRVRKMVLNYTSKMILQNVTIKKSSKSKVSVFEKKIHDHSIVELAKAYWLSIGNVTLSSTQLKAKWLSVCETYPFLSPKSGIDGFDETKKNLNMNTIMLKHLLESLDTRTRNIVLYDSSSKSPSLAHTISRIYWPNVKIITKNEDNNQIETLRSTLFSLSSYWCSTTVKEKLATKILSEAKCLDAKFEDISPKLSKLKIFRDWIDNSDRSILVSRITSLKQGVIGCFTVRQKGMGKARDGYGEWIGQVCGVNTKIKMRHDTCDQIEISSTSESVVLSRTLKKLIEEFKLKTSDNQEHCLKLTQSGNFKTTSSKGIKVTINKDLTFKYVEGLERWDWVLTFESCNLRLCVIDNSSGQQNKLTILSETFTDRDWNDLALSTYDNEGLVQWAKGKPQTGEELGLGPLSIIPTRANEFAKFIKRFKEHNIKCEWNLNTFRNTLMTTFGLKRTEVKSDNAPKAMELNPEDVNAVYNDIQSIMFTQENLRATAIGDWSEDTSFKPIESDLFCCEDDGADYQEMFNLLQNVDKHELENQNTSREQNLIPPVARRFFTSLEILSQTYQKMSFKELVYKSSENNQLQISGILGKVLSLIHLRFHYKSDLHHDLDAIDLEIKSNDFSSNVKTDDDLQKLDIDDLQEHVDEINTKLESCNDITKVSLINSKNKYLRLIDLKRMNKDEVKLDIHYETFLQKFVQFCNESNCTFPVLLSSDKSPNTVIQLINAGVLSINNELYFDLTDYEKEKVSYSWSTKRINSNFISFLSKTFRVNIILKESEFISSEFTHNFKYFAEEGSSDSDSDYGETIKIDSDDELLL